MKLILSIGGGSVFLLYSIYRWNHRDKTEDQANEYFPVQSASEIAAGHPIVGVA